MITNKGKAKNPARQASVYEIDGPPVSYFEVHADGENVPCVRLVYRTIAFLGHDKEAVQRAMNEVLNDMRDALCKINLMRIIFWRHRPEVRFESGRYHAYCRLETSPKLSDEFWRKWQGTDTRSVE